MMRTFILSPAAKQDLRDILHYKAEHDVDYALAFVDKLVEHFKKTLSAFPESGSVYKQTVPVFPESRSVCDGDIRKIAFEDHTVFYTIEATPESTDILRIIDLGKPLKERGIEF